ncbi:MAG: GDSL-type esterase/lipase family protein [Haliea sp.]
MTSTGSGHRRRWLLLALVVLVLGCTRESPYSPLPPGSVVLAFGDSVTWGTGAGRGEDFPSLLAERSGWQVVNAGVPGDTAAAARERIEGLLRQHDPALVIVGLGGNDFLRKRPDADVEADLRAILRRVQDHGAIPVLVAVPRLSLLRASVGALKDAPLYARLAEAQGVLLVPDVFSGVLSQESLRADTIHPNKAGYEVFAEELAAALRQAGLLPAT